MGKINIIRYVFMGFLFAMSFATLGLSGNLIGNSDPQFILPVYLPLDLAVGVLTALIVLPSIIVDFFRKGAFTSMVAVEIGWSCVLAILWVAAAGETTSSLTTLPANTCDLPERFADGEIAVDRNSGRPIIDPVQSSYCRQMRALEGLSWVAFFFLLAWHITLISLAATAHSRGNTSVWKKSVTNMEFKANVAHSEKAQKDYQYDPASQPLQQQYTGYAQPPQPPYPAVQPHPAGYPPQTQYPARYNASPAPASYNGAAQV